MTETTRRSILSVAYCATTDASLPRSLSSSIRSLTSRTCGCAERGRAGSLRASDEPGRDRRAAAEARPRVVLVLRVPERLQPAAEPLDGRLRRERLVGGVGEDDEAEAAVAVLGQREQRVLDRRGVRCACCRRGRARRRRSRRAAGRSSRACGPASRSRARGEAPRAARRGRGRARRVRRAGRRSAAPSASGRRRISSSPPLGRAARELVDRVRRRIRAAPRRGRGSRGSAARSSGAELAGELLQGDPAAGRCRRSTARLSSSRIRSSGVGAAAPRTERRDDEHEQQRDAGRAEERRERRAARSPPGAARPGSAAPPRRPASAAAPDGCAAPVSAASGPSDAARRCAAVLAAPRRSYETASAGKGNVLDRRGAACSRCRCSRSAS